MSEYSDLANKVAQLTQRLNDITVQARKIPELPEQNPLVPSSLLHVSNSGTSQSVVVQQILDAALSYRQNQLLSIGTITVAGNDLTVPAGATWVINNIDYSNDADIIINVPYAEDGFTRTDIIVADQLNNMYRVNGPETEGVSPSPNVPLNTVLVTTVNVTDSTIGYTPPSTGTSFPKIEFIADGVQTSFDIGTTKKAVSVFWNSVQLRDSDWSQTSNLITLTFVPESGAIIKPI